MKFKSGSLLFAVVVGIASICDVYGRATCNAGSYNYDKVSGCTTCPENCYCLGNNGHEKTGWSGYKIKKCDPFAKKPIIRKTGSDQNNNFDNTGVYSCPADFPHSNTGAKSGAECYNTINGKVIHDKNVTCAGGQYLPIISEKCANCPEGFVCRGGTWHVSFLKDQGKDTCASGTKPDSTHATCIEETFVKQYKVEEEAEEITVPAGQYLPANKDTPQSCSNISSKQFCPGGVFEKSNVKQGIFDCPYTVSDNHSKCTLTLTDAQMKYGVLGGKSGNSDAKCWTKTDPQDYKKCIMGTK